MKQNVLKYTALLLVVAGLFSCDKQISEVSDERIRNKFLVEKNYDYHDSFLAEYIYDKNNRLTKRIVTTVHNHPLRITDWRSEDIFEYKN